MITRVLRATFCLALRQPTSLQGATHPYQHLSARTRRVEIQILAKHQMPQLVESIDQLPNIKQIMSYNPYLTNGGYQFEEFPLKKLLHIALKMLVDNLQDREYWTKFQNIIKIRLHRCTIEQHMRLLYVMLKSWPFYRFKVDFINSICLGLKKEIHLMNGSELRRLFRITATGWDQDQKFNGALLLQLQTQILKRVIEKWQGRSRDMKNKALSLDGLYMWMSLSFPLAIRNNLFDLMIERKSIRLAELFTSIYHQTTTINLHVLPPAKQNLLIQLNLLSIFEPVHYLFGNKQKGKELQSWGDQFIKLKGSILSHGRSSIQRALKGPVTPKFLRWALTLIDCNILENMLEAPGQVQLEAGRQKSAYPRVVNLIQKTLKEEGEIEDKVALVWQVLRRRIVDWQVSRIHYNSISLQSLKHLSLKTAWCLIQIELALYTYSSSFEPLNKTHELLIQYLANNPTNFRNLDWLSFHYLRLSYRNEKKQRSIAIGTNQLQILQQASHDNVFIKIINKVIREVKQSDSNKLVQEQRELFLRDQNLVALKKFFIEVRLHQMHVLEPILPNFQRLPHFSNIQKNIAINAYSKPHITSPAVLLEKKLLNDLGWKVVNLPIPDFLNYTLSQKVQFIGRGIKQEQLLLADLQRRLLN